MADAEQTEQEKPLTTADLLKSHTVKVVESHMASSYEESAVGIALEGVHKLKQYKDIASHIKHQFDKKYPGSGKATEGVFHCVCGKNFASKSFLMPCWWACPYISLLDPSLLPCSCHKSRDTVLHPPSGGHCPHSTIQVQRQSVLCLRSVERVESVLNAYHQYTFNVTHCCAMHWYKCLISSKVLHQVPWCSRLYEYCQEQIVPFLIICLSIALSSNM